MKKHYLVIGASGKLGGALTQKLVEEGHQVSILILKNTWHPFLDNLNIKVHYGDITNIKEMEEAFKTVTHVYHVAGIVTYNTQIDDLVYKVNYIGVKNTIKLSKKHNIGKIVVTCSTAGHGIPNTASKPITEKDKLDLKKYKSVMYMYSKHLALLECAKAGKAGVNIVSVSPTAIYGAGDSTMHIGKTILGIKNKKITKAFPGGDTVIDLEDVINGHILAMKKGKAGEDYILANEMLSYKEMFNIIAKATNAPPISKTYPKWLMPIWTTYLKTLNSILSILGKPPKSSPQRIYIRYQYRFFDSSKARKELNWEPKIDFKKSISRAIEYYKENNLYK